MSSHVTIACADGEQLAGTLLEPDAARAAVVIAGGTAIPRRFYLALAEHLRSLDCAVLTFDYRGSGLPAAQLRRSPARMRDWGELDVPAAIDFMRTRYRALPLHYVGHSFGGQALAMASNASAIERAVAVAAQAGHWAYCAGLERYRVYALMKFGVPLALRVFGYLPGERTGLGEDLAPGIARDWRRWILSRNYFFDDATLRALENARHFASPLLMLGIADDPWATPRAIERLAAAFVNARLERATIDPQTFGLKSLGHMGFFRKDATAAWCVLTDYFALPVRETAPL